MFSSEMLYITFKNVKIPKIFSGEEWNDPQRTGCFHYFVLFSIIKGQTLSTVEKKYFKLVSVFT